MADRIPNWKTEFPFYRLATVGWAKSLLTRSISLLRIKQETILVDLEKVEFVDAFGVTYLAACLHTALRNGCQVVVRRPASPRVHQYLLDVGLYEQFGLDYIGRERKASDQRVDLVHITALQPGFVDPLLDFMENAQPFAPGLRPSIRTALFELVQNFAEHSKSVDGAWISGQVHRRSKATKQPRLTLCVLDLGVGIPTALRTVPEYRWNSDTELIELSTELGVSSVAASRGLGLNTIRRFTRSNGGELTIVANRGRVRFSGRRHDHQQLACVFPGTAAFLSLVPTSRGMYILTDDEESDRSPYGG